MSGVDAQVEKVTSASAFFESFLNKFAFIDIQQDEVSSKTLEFEVAIDKICLTKLAKKVRESHWITSYSFSNAFN